MTEFFKRRPDGDGAHLLHRTDFKMMSRFRPLGWLVEKLFGYRMMSKELRQTVDNAKHTLESEHKQVQTFLIFLT